MRIVLVLFFVNVLFLGCQRSNAIEREENKLILEGLFFFNSLEELEEKYGKSNAQVEFVEACETCGPEGSPLEESYYITTLFPNSKKEVVIYWNENKSLVKSISVEKENSEWTTKDGFRIGDKIEKFNGANLDPFEMIYFYDFIYNVNSNYSFSFNAELNFYPSEGETFSSKDVRLKGLVLKRIEINLPGTKSNL